MQASPQLLLSLFSRFLLPLLPTLRIFTSLNKHSSSSSSSIDIIIIITIIPKFDSTCPTEWRSCDVTKVHPNRTSNDEEDTRQKLWRIQNPKHDIHMMWPDDFPSPDWCCCPPTRSTWSTSTWPGNRGGCNCSDGPWWHHYAHPMNALTLLVLCIWICVCWWHFCQCVPFHNLYTSGRRVGCWIRLIWGTLPRPEGSLGQRC